MYNNIRSHASSILKQTTPYAIYSLSNSGIAGISKNSKPLTMAAVSIIHMLAMDFLFSEIVVNALNPYKGLFNHILDIDPASSDALLKLAAHIGSLFVAQQIMKRLDNKIGFLPVVLNSFTTTYLMHSYLHLSSSCKSV